MIIIKNELEIIAIGKLLNFIKFDCTDEDCLLFAASPLINNIYEKVFFELNEIYTLKGRPSFDGQDYIENYPIYLESIKRNIINTNNWEDLTLEIKEKYVQELIKPYKFKQETLDLLIHNNK